MELIGKHFRQLTRAAYEKHGFAYGEVLAQWDAIAGARLAHHTSPERIKWPRQAGSAQKYGGVLVVRAEPGFALELQYESPRLIERLNTYFGYGAVVGLKILAGEVRKSGPRQPVKLVPLLPDERQKLEESLAGIADECLKKALARLGTGLKSRKGARSQE